MATSLSQSVPLSDILVPIHIEVSSKGCKYVDSFTFPLFDPIISPDDFSQRTCSDLNLPLDFRWKISSQIQHQISCYRELWVAFNVAVNENIFPKENILQNISICVRHNSIEYCDTFSWDLTSPEGSPEKMARVTCSDLGLPPEMEPVIANKIREEIIRFVLQKLKPYSNYNIYINLKNICQVDRWQFTIRNTNERNQ